jgi:hypothetical protein
MIEHRHTKRVAVSDTVSIYHRNTLVAHCKTKDITVDGMALWAGPLQYHRNTMLEVEFADGDKPRKSLRLPAIVVYSATKVLGLMFTRTSDEVQAYLRARMSQARIKPLRKAIQARV